MSSKEQGAGDSWDTGSGSLGEYDGFKVVNKNERRVDALKLALGRATFSDDVEYRGMLHLKMLWSPHAHARVVSVDTSKAEALEGVVCVLHHGNTPRVPYTTAGQGHPEPSPYDSFMFPRKVRYVGDRVCAVAAESARIAQKAIELIEVEYELLEPIFEPERAIAPGAPVIHDEEDATGIHDAARNLAAEVFAEVGEVERGFADADLVLERRYRVGYQQHCPAEPHVAVTHIDEDNRLVVRVATQVPYHSRRILARVLGIRVGRIRVIKPRVGGGFGAKQEILLEDLPALVSLRTGRPCRFYYTRSEELVSSRTRHPQSLRIKMGLMRDGRILATEMDVLANCGGYGPHALTVQICTGGKALPLYRADHYRFRFQAVYTNLPNAGAFRGYGGPQGFFAIERHMDLAARELGLDPAEFRAKNVIGEGDDNTLAVPLGEGKEGFPQRIRSCGIQECIVKGKEAIGWDRRASLPKDGPKKRGMGMVCLMHGSGIPGVDMASALLKMNDDGSFNLLMGATDIGTGSDTVLSQIAAEALKVSLDDIIPYSSDTDHTPFDTGAYASSTTYISGMSVLKAAEQTLGQIVAVAAEMLEVPAAELSARAKAVHAPDGRSVSYSEVCLSALYTENQHQIMDHASHVSYESPPPFSAHFCEVEVDVETGGVKLLNYVAAVDCGVPINPAGCEGQTEGGACTMMGYGLSEEYLFDEQGRMVNDSFRGYKIFSSLDMPPFETILVRTYEPTGPFGAKSVAEIPTDGPAPVIASAIEDATGLFFDEIPITPEKLRAAWLAAEAASAQTSAPAEASVATAQEIA
jgi:putative selenate reductase molybdopterin-binding subunit